MTFASQTQDLVGAFSVITNLRMELFEALFLANYSLSLGSLVAAMIVWQNSLVLHNLSKMTSLLLHAFAPLTCHLVRWGVIPTGLQLPEAGLGVETGLGLTLTLIDIHKTHV